VYIFRKSRSNARSSDQGQGGDSKKSRWKAGNLVQRICSKFRGVYLLDGVQYVVLYTSSVCLSNLPALLSQPSRNVRRTPRTFWSEMERYCASVLLLLLFIIDSYTKYMTKYMPMRDYIAIIDQPVPSVCPWRQTHIGIDFLVSNAFVYFSCQHRNNSNKAYLAVLSQ